MNKNKKMTTQEVKEYALKKEIKRQSTMKQKHKNQTELVFELLLKSLKTLQNPFETEEILWDYIDKSKENHIIYFKQCDSKDLNIKTTIGDYTNKKGIVSKAHYTFHNKYFGSCKKLGNNPIYYSGNFRIEKERFDIDYNKVFGKEKIDIYDCFKPREDKCSVCYEMTPQKLDCDHCLCDSCNKRLHHRTCPICREQIE